MSIAQIVFEMAFCSHQRPQHELRLRLGEADLSLGPRLVTLVINDMSSWANARTIAAYRSRAPTGRPTEAQKPEGHLERIGDFFQVSSIYRPAPSRNLRRKFGGVGRCFFQRAPAGLAPGAGQAPLIRDLTQKAIFCPGGSITRPLRTTPSTPSRLAYSWKREPVAHVVRESQPADGC